MRWFGCLVLVLCALSASALQPDVALTQFAHSHWDIEQGLPQRSVFAIAQTTEGYLWVGTEEGLARFDGDRFVVFNKFNTPAFKRHGVRSMCTSGDGSLWIGTLDGVVRFDGERFSRIDVIHAGQSRTVMSLLCAADGSVYAGTQGGELFVLDLHMARPYVGWGGVTRSITALAQRRDGALLVGTFGDGPFVCIGASCHPVLGDGSLDKEQVTSILDGGSDGIWLGLYAGGVRLVSANVQRPAPFSADLPDGPVWSMLRDQDGQLWIAGETGYLARFDGRQVRVLSQFSGRDEVYPHVLFEDQERGLWIGSSSTGLHRLKNVRVQMFGPPEGIARDLVWSVMEDAQSRLWVGTNGGGVNRIADAAVSTMSLGSEPRAGSVFSMAQTQDGRLWFGTRGAGLYVREGERFVAVNPNTGAPSGTIPALFADSRGWLWAGGPGLGVKVWRNGAWETLDQGRGFDGKNPWAFAEDPSGVMWIGTASGGLYRYVDGKFDHVGTEQGLAYPNVVAIHAAADSEVWVSLQDGGLYKIVGGRAVALGRGAGLPTDEIYAILEDDSGNFWMSTPVGILRVAIAELDAVIDGRRVQPTVIRYGLDDGMRSIDCVGTTQPAAWKGRDGVLWFATSAGVARIDPARHLHNDRAPTVLIEQVEADGVDLPVGKPGALPPHTKRIDVKFTGLSLSAPSRVRFRYKLDGLDDQWRETGNVRSTSFTGLRAGNYHLFLAGANEDGIWSPNVARYAFSIAAPFTETPLYYAMLLTLASLLAFGYHRYRIVALKAKSATLEERNRIALELHDTAAQSLGMVTVRLDQVEKLIPSDGGELKERFDKARAAIERSAEELRSAVAEMRADGQARLLLHEVLRERIANQIEGIGIDLEFDCSGSPRSLGPLLLHHVCRIAQEAVSNALRHSGTRTLRLDIDYREDEFCIGVEDRGRGLRGGVEDARYRGSGLRGMAERAAQIGGQLAISPAAGGGTRVELVSGYDEAMDE